MKKQSNTVNRTDGYSILLGILLISCILYFSIINVCASPKTYSDLSGRIANHFSDGHAVVYSFDDGYVFINTDGDITGFSNLMTPYVFSYFIGDTVLGTKVGDNQELFIMDYKGNTIEISCIVRKCL